MIPNCQVRIRKMPFQRSLALMLLVVWTSSKPSSATHQNSPLCFAQHQIRYFLCQYQMSCLPITHSMYDCRQWKNFAKLFWKSQKKTDVGISNRNICFRSCHRSSLLLWSTTMRNWKLSRIFLAGNCVVHKRKDIWLILIVSSWRIQSTHWICTFPALLLLDLVSVR